MGELIKSSKPKGLEYTEKLLSYQKPSNLFDKAKTYFKKTDKTEANSISKWCRILGKSDTNNHTRDFLKHLIEEKALVFERTEGEPPNETELYSLDKTRLLECYRESSDYKMRKDLIKKTINKVEPNEKIIRDF